MTATTARASSSALSKTATRRAVLGAVLASAAALPATAAAEPPALSDVDRQVLDLWKRRADLRAAAMQTAQQYWAADKQLPEWAQDGPKYCRPDGSPGGTKMFSEWPMVACLSRRPVNDRGQINARPDPDDLLHELLFALQKATKEGGGDEAAILRDYSQTFAEVYDRRRQQIAEIDRLNLGALGEQDDAAWDAVAKIEGEFENYMAESVLALAVVLMVANHDDCEEIDGLNRAALRAIRPQLIGEIAEDADRVLAEDEEVA